MLSQDTPKFQFIMIGTVTAMALCLFALFALLHVHQTISQDDLNYMVAAKTLRETGTAIHYGYGERIKTYSPELYLQVLATGFRLFGVSEAVARLPGIMSGLLSIVLVFLITNSLSHGTQIERLQWASVVSLLYAVTPGLIQGALILAIDNTILIPPVLLMCWSFIKYLQQQKIQWLILTALAMMLALWGRVTTPPAIGLVMSAYALAGPWNWKTKLRAIGALLLGAVLFIVSWYSYCLVFNVPFSGPFAYALRSLTGKTHDIAFSQIAQNVLYLMLWVGFFTTILFLVVVSRRMRVFFSGLEGGPEDLFLLSGLSLVIGYFFIGGAIFGYPKYQAPAIPLLYIFIGIALSKTHSESHYWRAQKLGIALFLALIACALQMWIVGDWIYLIRYQVRASLAFLSPSLSEIGREMSLKAAFVCAVYGLLFVIFHRFSSMTVVGMLFAFSIGSNVGMAVLQGSARYHTGYNYGGLGTVEVAAYVRTHVPADSVVIAPNEVTYYLKLPNSPYWPDPFWTDIDQLKKRLADQNTSGLVYSIATNTILQIQTITSNESLRAFLRKNYDHTTVGTYRVWIRKANNLQATSRHLQDKGSRFTTMGVQ